MKPNIKTQEEAKQFKHDYEIERQNRMSRVTYEDIKALDEMEDNSYYMESYTHG